MATITEATAITTEELGALIEKREHLLILGTLPMGKLTELEKSLAALGLVGTSYPSAEAFARGLAAARPQDADVLIVHSAVGGDFAVTALASLFDLGPGAGAVVSPRLKSIIVVDDSRETMWFPTPGYFTAAVIAPPAEGQQAGQ